MVKERPILFSALVWTIFPLTLALTACAKPDSATIACAEQTHKFVTGAGFTVRGSYGVGPVMSLGCARWESAQ